MATMTYDNADRLTKVVNKKGASTLSSFTFGSLDGVGNPQSLTRILGGATTTTSYTYDPYDRLTGACNKVNCTGSGLTGLGYTFDPVGNRLTQVAYGSPNVTTTYRYDVDDRLCWAFVGTSSNACSSPPGGATIYTFESNGNETGAGSTTFAYDLENRMRSATVGGTTTTYTHDGDGNRLSATTSGATTNYLWDVNEPLPQLALERSGGSTIRAYSYGAGLNSMSTGGSNYFYLLDAYSGVANLTSPSGATEWTYKNDPFGSGTATKNDPTAPTNVMRFDGQFLDPATGLYNLRARTYDPGLGRFLQIDPIPNPRVDPHTSTYAYVADRPTVMEDPSGQSARDILKEMFGHPVASWEEGSTELYEDWRAGWSVGQYNFNLELGLVDIGWVKDANGWHFYGGPGLGLGASVTWSPGTTLNCSNLTVSGSYYGVAGSVSFNRDEHLSGPITTSGAGGGGFGLKTPSFFINRFAGCGCEGP